MDRKDAKKSNKLNSKKVVHSEKMVKKQKISSFEKAKQVYEQIQEQKKKEREQKNKDREQKQKAVEEYNSRKKKMHNAIRKRNKKGQPNLGSQMEAILDKIQNKSRKNEL